MDINITGDNFAQWTTEKSKLLWNLYSKKALLAISFYFLFGVVISIIGFSEEHKNNETVSKSPDNMKTIIELSTIYKDPLSVAILGGIGVGYISFATLNLISFYRKKAKFFNSLNAIIYRHRSVNNKYSLRLNEHEIFYQDFELTYQVKWTTFYNYKLYKDYLILSSDSENILMVPLTQLAKVDAATLLSFVKTKLVEKKKFI